MVVWAVSQMGLTWVSMGTVSDADLALAGGARGLVTAGRGNAMEAGDVVKFYSASRGM